MPKGRTGRNAGNCTDFRCPQAVVGRIRRENPSAVGISTIKVVDGEGYVQGTPNRALMWNVQTPQVFEKAVYQRAMRKAEQEGADYTDDCQLVEQLGVGVHLCMGSYENIKITTRDDLALGEHILQLREEDA